MTDNNAERVLSLLYRTSDSLFVVGTILRGLAAIAESSPITHGDLQAGLRQHNRQAERVAEVFRNKTESGASVRPVETL